MYKKVFFKCIFLFLLLFIAGISLAYSLNPSYLFLEKNQTNTSDIDMLLLFTPSENHSSGSELTVSFPIAEGEQWCQNDGASLSVSGTVFSKIDFEGWEIDSPLPGDLEAECFQGDGVDYHDRIIISGIDDLLANISYGVQIFSSPDFSTGPTGGSNNVIVQLTRGVISEAVAYAIYLQAPGGVTVSGFVDEDFFSIVQVLDPVVEKGIWSRVRVRILNSQGNPIPGRQVEVKLNLENTSNWEIENPSGVTNSNGLYQTRVRGFQVGIVNIGAIDKSFSQNIHIQDTANLTVIPVPTVTLHQLPMYTPGLSRKITWGHLSGNYEYFVEASLSSNFNSIDKTSGWISSNEFTFTNLQHGQAYYYRAKVRNIANQESAYSNVVSSIQAEKPEGAIEVLDPVVEKGIWSRVRITLVDSNGNPLPGRKIVFSINRSDLSKWDIEQPSGLTNSNGVAQGRIRGFEAANVKVTAEDRTIPMHFQIDAFDWLQVRELPTLTLHGLPNYSKGLSRLITWNNISGGYQYYVELSTNPDFTSPTNSGWISTNQFLFTNLKHAQGYFYRAKLRNSANSQSSYSNIVTSIQDNKPPNIEKINFEIISQNNQRKAKFTFLIKDLSKVTNVRFRCEAFDEEVEKASYVPCGNLSSLNDFHYVVFDKEDLEDYKVGEDEYLLDYCVLADDIVGNKGSFCREKVFSLEAVEIIEIIEEELVEEVVSRENVITRITTPARDAVRRNIEDTVSYIQDLEMDDSRIETTSVAIVSTVAPITLLSFFLNPANWYPIGQVFLGIIGVFKRKKKVLPYGYIYDAISKEPINRAIVRIYQGKKLVATTVSNVYGAFNASLDPGEYLLKISSVGYTFPSKLVTGSVDSPLQNIYRGGSFVIKEESPIKYSIPLDPMDPSNVDYFKTMLFGRLGKIFLALQKVLVIVGLLVAFFLYLRNPVTFNLVVVLFYIPLLFIHFFLSFSSQRQSFGVVKDEKGKPLSKIVLGLREMEFEKLIAKRVTNDKGRYKFLVPGGKYRLEVLSLEYEIKYPKEKALLFEENPKKQLLVNRKLVLKEKDVKEQQGSSIENSQIS